MKTSSIVASCCAAVLAAAGVLVAAQDKNQWQPAKPGPEHAVLKSFEGTWDAGVKSWAEPGKPPTESKGVETSTLSCGGFWLVTDHKGELMGQSFQGHGLLGYDQAKKKYISTWVDSMSSSLMTFEGSYDAATKTLTTTAHGPGCDGKPVRWTGVHTIKDNDHHTFTMSMAGPDGKDCTCMEIAYTRRK